MVAQNRPWMDIEWTWRGMTGSVVSWIPVAQGYCSGVRTRLGYSSGARERIKGAKKILKTAAVVSGREGWGQHARRGGERGIVVVGERDAEKKGDIDSAEWSTWGQIGRFWY